MKAITLGWLIERLECVENKKTIVVFDDGKFYPTTLGSWRGKYCDLAIRFNYGDNKSIHTVDSLLYILKRAIGSEYEGYKGGDFLMCEETVLWVANYGESRGFKRGKSMGCQYISGVKVLSDRVAIITDLVDYCDYCVVQYRHQIRPHTCTKMKERD